MRIHKIDPTGVTIETINLEDCFINKVPYARYLVECIDGTYMLNDTECYPVGRISNYDEDLGNNDNFKFG